MLPRAFGQGQHWVAVNGMAGLAGQVPPTLVIPLSVVDDGGGILESTEEQAGEPFRTTTADGPGVGLVIVQSIMDQHVGRLDVEHGVGRGLTARLLVPPWHEGSLL